MTPNHVLCFRDRSDYLNLGVVPFLDPSISAVTSSPRQVPQTNAPKIGVPVSFLLIGPVPGLRNRNLLHLLFPPLSSAEPNRTELEGRGRGRSGSDRSTFFSLSLPFSLLFFLWGLPIERERP